MVQPVQPTGPLPGINSVCLPARLLGTSLQEQSGEEEAEAEQGFRIGGGATTTAKGGLEQVHLVHGLGPPAQLEDGTAGVAPHPGMGGSGFAAAARAEHHSEADLFKRLLLSRGGS